MRLSDFLNGLSSIVHTAVSASNVAMLAEPSVVGLINAAIGTLDEKDQSKAKDTYQQAIAASDNAHRVLQQAIRQAIIDEDKTAT